MPFAVTHVLAPIILVDLVRDHILKNPKALPNRFVFLAGLAGLLLDIDLPLVTALNLFGANFPSHRVIFHNLWIPLSCLGFFAFFYLLLKDKKSKTFGKVFLMLFIGTSLHLILDAVLTGNIMPFFPLATYTINWNLVGAVSEISGIAYLTILISMDALLLLFWLYHEEMQHKISDYF